MLSLVETHGDGLVSLFNMKRGLVIVAIVVTLTSGATVTLLSNHYRSVALSQSELALRPIPVPRLWANECSKIRRIVAQSRAGLTQQTGALSADELAIYRAVLAARSADSTTVLNVSNATEPLDGSDSSHDLSNCECLDGLDVESIVSATHSSHRLTRDVLAGTNMRLVDAGTQMAEVGNNDPRKQLGKGQSVESLVNKAFATGLLSLSEIAFDRQHHRALVSYSFVCGSLCGSGAVLMFEKVNGEWKKSGLNCGGWVS